MNRRGFLGGLAAFAAQCTLDPEFALWVPGARIFSIPSNAAWDGYYADSLSTRMSNAAALAAQREAISVDLPSLIWESSALWGRIQSANEVMPIRPSRIPIMMRAQ